VTDSTVLAGPAWITGGLNNRPGHLVTASGRVTFTDGEPHFDVARDELTDVTCPWYRFGGGVKLRAAGTLYKIAFVRPDGRPSPDPSLVDGAPGALGPGRHDRHRRGPRGCAPWSRGIGTGRKATKQWGEILPA
jgi:hypothetical protein